MTDITLRFSGWDSIPDVIARHVLGAFERSAGERTFPNAALALSRLAALGRDTWRMHAQQLPGREGRPLRLGTSANDPMVRLDQQELASSIVARPSSTFEWWVGSTSRQAETVEHGTPGGTPMDLHAVLPYAPKVRRSKKGHLYLRIPFRHATTSASEGKGYRFQGPTDEHVLPRAVIHAMKNKRRYQIVGTYQEPSVSPTHQGRMVQRYLYSSNPGRLSEEELIRMGLPEKQIQRLTGLMRVGKARHGAYLTIRTLSQANPEGWRVSPYAAHPIMQQSMNAVGAQASSMIDDAIRRDIAEIANQVGAS